MVGKPMFLDRRLIMHISVVGWWGGLPQRRLQQ